MPQNHSVSSEARMYFTLTSSIEDSFVTSCRHQSFAWCTRLIREIYAILNESVNAALTDGKPQMHTLLSNGPGTGISFTLRRSLHFLAKAFGTSDVHFSDRITTALYILHTFTNAKMPSNDDSCRCQHLCSVGHSPFRWRCLQCRCPSVRPGSLTGRLPGSR